MSSFPSLPLFTDAFLADTGHLNAHETGAYLLLLMMAWRLPDCRLPDDDTKLARWARVDARQWAKTKSRVMEFWTLADGYWTQKRLLLERDKVRKFAEVSRENGKRGGRPKSQKLNGSGNPAGYSEITRTKAPNPNPISTSSLHSDVEAAFEAWNEMAELTGLAKAEKLSRTREANLRARLRDAGPDGWAKVLARIKSTPFLRGTNDRGWRCDFDFAVSERGFLRISEGKYGHATGPPVDEGFRFPDAKDIIEARRGKENIRDH